LEQMIGSVVISEADGLMDVVLSETKTKQIYYAVLIVITEYITL
jgi:hypothetical protein